MNNSKIKVQIASLTGFVGVGFGAFGAHALKEHLELGGHLETWQTAVFYHLVHAIVILGLALVSSQRFGAAYWFIFAGIIIFCGSLYLIAIARVGAFGVITPFGGVAFLVGWWLIFIKARYL